MSQADSMSTEYLLYLVERHSCQVCGNPEIEGNEGCNGCLFPGIVKGRPSNWMLDKKIEERIRKEEGGESCI